MTACARWPPEHAQSVPPQVPSTRLVFLSCMPASPRPPTTPISPARQRSSGKVSTLPMSGQLQMAHASCTHAGSIRFHPILAHSSWPHQSANPSRVPVLSLARSSAVSAVAPSPQWWQLLIVPDATQKHGHSCPIHTPSVPISPPNQTSATRPTSSHQDSTHSRAGWSPRFSWPR